MTDVMISTTIPPGGGDENPREMETTSSTNADQDKPLTVSLKGSDPDNGITQNTTTSSESISDTKPEPTPSSEPIDTKLKYEGEKEREDETEAAESNHMLDDDLRIHQETDEATELHNGNKRTHEEILDLKDVEQDDRHDQAVIKRLRTNSVSDRDELMKSPQRENNESSESPGKISNDFKAVEETDFIGTTDADEEHEVNDKSPSLDSKSDEINSLAVVINDQDSQKGEESGFLAKEEENTEPVLRYTLEEMTEEKRETDGENTTETSEMAPILSENNIGNSNGESESEIRNSIENGLPDSAENSVGKLLLEEIIPEGPPVETHKIPAVTDAIESILRLVEMEKENGNLNGDDGLLENLEEPPIIVEPKETVSDSNVRLTVDPPNMKLIDGENSSEADNRKNQVSTVAMDDSRIISSPVKDLIAAPVDCPKEEISDDLRGTKSPTPDLPAESFDCPEKEVITGESENPVTINLDESINSADGELQIDLDADDSESNALAINDNIEESADRAEVLANDIGEIDSQLERDLLCESEDVAIKEPPSIVAEDTKVMSSVNVNMPQPSEPTSSEPKVVDELETIDLSSPENSIPDEPTADEEIKPVEDKTSDPPESIPAAIEPSEMEIEDPKTTESLPINETVDSNENTVDPPCAKPPTENESLLSKDMEVAEAPAPAEQTTDNISAPIDLDEMKDIEMKEIASTEVPSGKSESSSEGNLTGEEKETKTLSNLNGDALKAALATFKTSFKDITREQLEKLVLEKMIEAMLFKSKAAQNAQQIAVNGQKAVALKEKLEEAKKQCRTLEFMYTNALEQVRSHEKKGCKIQPRPVCRTVGIQSQSIHFVKCRTCGTKTTTGTFKSVELGKRVHPLNMPSSAVGAVDNGDPPPAKRLQTMGGPLNRKSNPSPVETSAITGPVIYTQLQQTVKQLSMQQTQSQPPPLVSRSVSLPVRPPTIPHQMVLLTSTPTTTANPFHLALITTTAPTTAAVASLPTPTAAAAAAAVTTPKKGDVVDLTEDDDVPPSTSIAPTATTVAQTVVASQAQQFNGYAVQRSMSLGTAVSPLALQSSHRTIAQQPINTIGLVPKRPMTATDTRKPAIAKGHPAPLPSHLKNIPSYTMHSVRPPPAPEVRVRRHKTGIMLSWTMATLHVNHAQVKDYQLYGYQATEQPPNPNNWKLLGNVKAMRLPMAVTLSQFQTGQVYYFCVRARDVLDRYGSCSLPTTWT